GSVTTNMTAIGLIFFAEWMTREFDLKETLKSKNLWKSILIFFLTFAATNPHILLNFSQFQRLVSAMNAYWPNHLWLGEWSQWKEYLRSFVSEQMHWALLPLLAAGAWFGWNRRDKFVLLCLFGTLGFFLQNLVQLRHPSVN